MDDFFMTHLPEEVVKAAGDYQNNELDEDAIRRQMRSEIPLRRNSLQSLRGNDPGGSSGRVSGDNSITSVKRRKSDLTLAFMDSSEQVAKLAQKSEMGQNIDRMRNVAKHNRRGSFVPPTSKFKNETLERHEPREMPTMTPFAFKMKYSKDLTKDMAMRASIETNTGSKDLPPTIIEDPDPSDQDSPVERDATDSPDPEESVSWDNDDNIESDMSDHQGPKNAPPDHMVRGESGPKEGESGDAEGKV
jgi:hypothetical protein